MPFFAPQTSNFHRITAKIRNFALSDTRNPAEIPPKSYAKMKAITRLQSVVFLIVGLFSFLTFSCTNTNKTETTTEILEDSITSIAEDDNSEPYTITKKKMGGYDVWEIVENPRKVAQLTEPYYFEICPKGLFDKPISGTKAEYLKNAPVTYRDATWSAAYRALRNLIPVKDSKIIFDYSKFNRQINNDKECLFFGSCKIKNENGKYVEAEANITVIYILPEDMRKPEGWYCVGNIVF